MRAATTFGNNNIMAVQYISLRDQGYGDSSQRLMDAGRQFWQMQLQQKEAERQQQAFGLEQQQRQIANQIAATNAAAQPQQIQQRTQLSQAQIDAENQRVAGEAQMQPLRVKGAGLGIEHQQNELAQDPVTLALAQEHLKGAQLANVPTEENAESTMDANGNLTETISRTKNGQPFGSTSKIVRGNRPGTSKTNVVYYPETDPETGVTQRVPYTVGTDAAGNPVRNALPVAGQPAGETSGASGDITQAVLNKYFNPDGTPKEGGGFMGIGQHTLADRPTSLSDAQALNKLRLNAQAQNKLGVHLDPSANPLGSGPSANPTQPSKPAVPAGGVSPSSTNGNANTGTPKTTPTTFDKLKVNDTFMQNGKKYVKTGPRSAKPVGAEQPAVATTPADAASASEVDNPTGP